MAIDKTKIISFEWKKERKKSIGLVYESDSGNSRSAQIDAREDPEGFAAFLEYLREIETDYTSNLAENELTFEKIKQNYRANFDRENVQAFSIKYPSTAGNKYSISAITND